MRRGALIALSMLLMGRVAHGAAHHALEAIDACMAKLDPEVDVGFRAIAARCPYLEPALASGDLDRWFPPDWREPQNDLSVRGLAELRLLLAQGLTMRPVSRAPSIERLQEELARLAVPPPPRKGLWATLASWLRRVGGRREPSPFHGELARLLRRIELAPVATRITLSAALAGLVGLAVLLITNELRAAGRWRAPDLPAAELGPAERGGGGVAAAPQTTPPVDLAGEVRRLLGSILERLSRIRGAGLGSLTARELLCAVQLEDRAAASELTQVLLTAERMRYAGVPASRGELVAAVDGARRLLERLEAR